jgi:hypothetical protein
MSNLYIVVYTAPRLNKVKRLYSSNVNITGFVNCIQNHNNWHYDIGDDPSFYCSNNHHTNLTWGICRPDIRNNISSNDVVLYFCFCAECNSYFLTGLATVDALISQSDIWTNKNYAQYNNFFNLLIKIKPSTSKWEHFEPLFMPDGNGKHDDWLDRIIIPSNANKFVINGDQIKYHIKKNYVIFKNNPKETYILKNQIQVATWKPGDDKETWMDCYNCNKINDFTFKYNQINERTSLRISSNGHPHRHIRYKLTLDVLNNWKSEVLNFLHKLDNN